MTWPTNPYLSAFLKSPDGLRYLAQNGQLDAYYRRHLLDDPDAAPNMDDYFPVDASRQSSTADRFLDF